MDYIATLLVVLVGLETFLREYREYLYLNSFNFFSLFFLIGRVHTHVKSTRHFIAVMSVSISSLLFIPWSPPFFFFFFFFFFFDTLINTKKCGCFLKSHQRPCPSYAVICIGLRGLRSPRATDECICLSGDDLLGAVFGVSR